MCLLHGLATREGDAFQRLFLACPQNFLNYGINLDILAMKRMTVRVPTANTMEFTTLEKHHCAQAWPISTTGGNERVKQHGRPPSVLALLLLGYVAGVISRFLPFNFHHVPTTEVIGGFLTGLAGKAIQINGGNSTFVDSD